MLIQILSDQTAEETLQQGGSASALAEQLATSTCLLSINWRGPEASSGAAHCSGGDLASSSVDLKNQPELYAAFLDMLGQIYVNRGIYDQARLVLQRAVALRVCLFGERHPLVAASKVHLAGALRRLNDTKAARKSIDDALAINTETFGPDSVPVAEALNELAALQLQNSELENADDSAARGERILAARKDPRVTLLQDTRAKVQEACKKYAEAEQIYRAALEIDRSSCLGENHPRYALHLHNLGAVYLAQSRIDDATRALEESYARLRRIHGPQHPDLIDVVSNLGRLARGKCDLPKAEEYFEEVLRLDRAIRGPEHPYVGYDLVNLAYIEFERGSFSTAENYVREALAIYHKGLPEVHGYTGTALVLLGRVLIKLNRPDEAEQVLRRAVEIFAQLYKQCDGNCDDFAIDLGWSKAVLGHALGRLKRTREAEPLLQEGQALVEKILGATDLYAKKIFKWLKELSA